jgi:hypothetical protein
MYTSVTSKTQTHNISIDFPQSEPINTSSNPAKNSLNVINLMGEFPSIGHWQNCCGGVEDDFLEIDAII